MNSKLAFIVTFAILSMIVIGGGCGSRQNITTDSDEEKTYQLVGIPCAEGDYVTAVRRADSLLNGDAPMSDSLRAFIMIDRNVAILEAGHDRWGIAYSDTVSDFGRSHGIGLAVMQSLQHKGIYSRRNGDYDNAISFYKQGLDLAVEEGNKEMLQVFCESLAIACAEKGLYDEAYAFGRRSLEVSEELEDSIQILNSVGTLGAILAKQGKYAESIAELLPYHAQSVSSRPLLRVKYLTPLLRSYLQLDSLHEVRELLAEVYESLDGYPRNTQAYLVAVNAEAGLAEKEGRYADQWDWLLTADSIGMMGTSTEVWYLTRARCLANLGRYQEACQMHMKAYNALDSIRSSSNDRRLSELMVRYETLSKDNDIIRLESERLTWILVAVVSLVAVAAVVLAAVLIARNASSRQERERKEEYLRGLEHERQRIARELHDDIAGSLIGLQLLCHGLPPDKMESRLMKIAARVRSMSHELMPVEFQEIVFSTMLLDYVASVNSRDSAHKVVLAEEGSFDWDGLEPVISHELYRMVQESVMNAISHGSGGEIRVDLRGDSRFEIVVTNRVDVADRGTTGHGSGLSSLKTRASIINASVEIKEENELYIVKIMQSE